MKKLLTILLILISIVLYGQDAIFNVNTHNLYLLNYASESNNIVNVNLDNSFEYYKNSRNFNTTSLNFSRKTFGSMILGANLKHDYQNVSSFNAIAGYKILISRRSNITAAINAGFINYNIQSSEYFQKYTFNPKKINSNFKTTNFNIGFSTVYFFKENTIGISANNLNMPSLPDDKKSKLPIKYVAYIRNTLIKDKLSSILIYQYQNRYFYNNLDLDYYFNMLSYLGVNLEYNFHTFTFGLGSKYLFDNKLISSLIIGYHNDKYSISFSPSLFTENNNISIFNQVTIYYKITYQPIMRAIGCPSF